MNLQRKLRVLFSGATSKGKTKKLREKYMKLLCSTLQDILCLQRSSLTEKNYHQLKMHSNSIYLMLWSSACNSTVNHLDLEDNKLTAIMTDLNIAPLEVVKLVACNGTGKYIE